MEYQRGNCKKAAKILSTSPENESIIFQNNEALVLYGMGKKSTSVFKFMSILTKDSSRKHIPIEVAYNLAAAQLFSGNFVESKRIFSKLTPHFKYNPRLWLRSGETSLQQQTQHFLEDIDLNRHKQNMVSGFVGEGIHRKLVLMNCMSQTKLDPDVVSFANSCFLNGLNCFQSKYLTLYPSNVSSEQEMSRIKTALLLSLAFTHLVLDEVSLAHSFAKAALAMNPKGYQKALANLYVGECYLLMDRVTDALVHLNPALAVEEPVSPDDQVLPSDFISSWFPSSCKVILTYNQALSQTLKGDYDKANEFLKLIGSGDTVPIHVIMLAIYIQLQQGYIDGAKALIRQHLPHLR